MFDWALNTPLLMLFKTPLGSEILASFTDFYGIDPLGFI